MGTHWENETRTAHCVYVPPHCWFVTVKLEISYHQALERHPQAVTEIILQLAKSRSKERGTTPENLTWLYEWCVEYNVVGVPETKSLEDRTYCSLSARKGRWVGYGTMTLQPVPTEVMTYMRDLGKT